MVDTSSLSSCPVITHARTRLPATILSVTAYSIVLLIMAGAAWSQSTYSTPVAHPVSAPTVDISSQSIAQSQINSLGVSLVISILIWLFFGRRGRPAPGRYSTIWRRILSALVDSLVLWPVGAAMGFMAMIPWSASPMAAAAVAFVCNLLIFAYWVILHARNGQTIGKMLCRVKVINFATGAPVTLRQALLREGTMWLGGLPILAWEIWNFISGRETLRNSYLMDSSEYRGTGFAVVFSLASAWIIADIVVLLATKKRRALHDVLAGTVSVNVDAAPDDVTPGLSTANRPG